MKTMSWITHIDRLTRSIEEVSTGKNFDTEVFELKKADLKLITKANGWNFDWQREWSTPHRIVYKLVIKGDESNVIQCLISIEDSDTYLFLPLIETAPHNLGKLKRFAGAPANLIAFACKRAFELGYDGEVAFVSKTKLVSHYKEMLGAVVIAGSRMAILSDSARKLVSLYFKDFRFP